MVLKPKWSVKYRQLIRMNEYTIRNFVSHTSQLKATELWVCVQRNYVQTDWSTKPSQCSIMKNSNLS